MEARRIRQTKIPEKEMYFLEELMIAACFISLRHLLVLDTGCGLNLVQAEGFYWEKRSKAFDSH